MSKPKVERWAVLAGEDIRDLIRKWCGKECTDEQSDVIVQIIIWHSENDRTERLAIK